MFTHQLCHLMKLQRVKSSYILWFKRYKSSHFDLSPWLVCMMWKLSYRLFLLVVCCACETNVICLHVVVWHQSMRRFHLESFTQLLSVDGIKLHKIKGYIRRPKVIALNLKSSTSVSFCSFFFFFGLYTW